MSQSEQPDSGQTEPTRLTIVKGQKDYHFFSTANDNRMAKMLDPGRDLTDIPFESKV